ncbi:unnamed protein product [Closterium sp. NIES-53]
MGHQEPAEAGNEVRARPHSASSTSSSRVNSSSSCTSSAACARASNSSYSSSSARSNSSTSSSSASRLASSGSPTPTVCALNKPLMQLCCEDSRSEAPAGPPDEALPRGSAPPDSATRDQGAGRRAQRWSRGA